MSYLIFADVSVDIDVDEARQNDIHFVPMEYVIGTDTFICDRPETAEFMHEYYDKLRNKIETHTSQITPNHYFEFFEKYVKDGMSILYISLSSGLSNTYESAMLAVENLKEEYDNVNIEVVDSLSATGGMGILCESAADNRKSGMSLKENAEWLRSNANRINHWFRVEDLMYLKRGGRVSAAAAVIGTALNIKPILKINAEGRLEMIDKKRGSRLALKCLIDKYGETRDEDSGLVYISCADCMDDALNLKEQLLELYPDITVKITMLSPIIGAHTGPDMLSLIHYGKIRT